MNNKTAQTDWKWRRLNLALKSMTLQSRQNKVRTRAITDILEIVNELTAREQILKAPPALKASRSTVKPNKKGNEIFRIKKRG